MEIEEIKEKIQTELKWSSYYFIISIILSFFFSFFKFLILNQNTDNVFILFFFNILLLLYLSRKCIREKKLKKNVTFISKLIITLNIFTIYYLFNSLMYLNNDEFYQLIIPKRELEIQVT